MIGAAAGSLPSVCNLDSCTTHKQFTLQGEAHAKGELFRKISAEYKKSNNINLYDTPAHRVLLTSVHNKCDLLTKKRFVGRNGAHSRLIQGPKGVGKSTILEAYAKLCTDYHPDVYPIYISFDELNIKGSQSGERTIMELVKDQLSKVHGLKIDPAEGHIGPQIARALEAANKYVLLIVDEVEEVYRTSESNPHRLNRLHILGDLNWLGNQKTGRFAVYLCGSSSSCPLLVTCHASKEEFPLLSDAPHLNGTKYNTLRLPVSAFTDLNAVENIIAGYFNLQTDTVDVDDRRGLARLMAFGVGAVPRAVDAMCVKIEEGEMDLFTNLPSSAHLSGSRLHHDTSLPFLKHLHDKFRAKNENVANMLRNQTDGMVDLDLVRTVSWETAFIPLSYEDIFEAWNGMCASINISFTENRDGIEKLQYSVLELCDKGQITYTAIDRGIPVGIFPLYPAQVFMSGHSSSDLAAFANTYDIQLKNSLHHLKNSLQTAGT